MIFSTRNGTMEAYLYFSIFKLIIAFTILLHNSAYADDDRYEACSKPFQCGTVSNLGYPFYDGDTRPEYCSYPGFKLNCSSVPPVLNVSSSEEHYVLGVKTGLPVVTVARIDYWNGYCPENLHNTSINSTLFSYLDDVDEDVILYYECSNVSVPLTNSFHCSNMSSPFGYFVTEDLFESAYGRNKPRDTCNRSIVVPITNYESSALRVRDTFSLMSAFRYGFQLQWNAENNLCDECRKSGGACGFNTTTSRFTCYCPDQPYASKCPDNIFVPIDQSAAASIRDVPTLLTALRNGFDLKWSANNTECANCLKSGGVCGYSTSLSRFACFCQDHPYDLTCPEGSHGSTKKSKTTLVVTASLVVGSAMIAVALLYLKRQMDSQNIFILSKKERRNSKDVEAVLKRYGKHGPERYTYREIKQITNHFKEKLGEGGYGGVYKGKLQNGSLVAVKLLKNPDSNGKEFTNEVASISETNHVNVVTLLGYCSQGRKRALVYDFMPNGSLDKYIYSEKTQNPLSWETLHQIAIGIGRGLEYLHQGCRTRILHFDIKPHNILLDEKFCPKVSDFGLAKPYLQTKSLMTMSGTRGTPGYIAPEVFCRGFGGASHKSDVYSYGMLVLDLVGCRKNSVTGEEKTSSEQYFPHWIYKQFELEENHELQGISNDEEKVLQRKMVIVSLWCIQMNPSSRPSISRAVEMLEEELESLQIPPMPTLSSPPKLYPENPSTNTTSL